MKKFLIKFYDKTSTFSGTLNPRKVVNDIVFSSKINKGQGEISIKTNYKKDELPAFITNESYMSVSVFTDENPNGKVVYRGVVGKITPYLSNGAEAVDIRVLGLGTFLSRGYLKDGASYTKTFSGSVEDGVEAVIDHFKTVYTNSPIHYTAGSIGTTGQNIDIEFKEQTWQQCLDTLVEAAGGSWFYFIDQNGLVTFKQKYTGTKHRFTKGFDLHEIYTPNTAEKIINKVVIRWGDDQTTIAENSTSITNFGLRERVIFNSEVNDSTSAAALANSKLAEFSDEKRIPKIKLNDRYPYESINIGDTCVVQNYENDLTDMFIHSMNYSLEVATLFISEKVELADILYSTAEEKAREAAGQVEVTGTTGSPGGSNTQVQFNDNSSFGGDSDFTYNKTTKILEVSAVGTFKSGLAYFQSGLSSTVGYCHVGANAYLNTSGAWAVPEATIKSSLIQMRDGAIIFYRTQTAGGTDWEIMGTFDKDTSLFKALHGLEVQDGFIDLFTADPTLKVRNSGGTYSNISLQNGATEVATFRADHVSGEIKIGSTFASYFPTFWAGNAERARFSTDGDFMIGTTAALAKMTITPGAGKVGVHISRTEGQKSIMGSNHLVIDGYTSSDVVFLQNYNSGDVKMCGGGGKVGIGVTPSYRFEVQASSRVASHYLSENQIELGYFGSGDRNTFMDFHSQNSTDYDARIIRWSGSGGAFDIYQNTGTFNVYMGSTKRLQLDQDGDFQIFTSGTASTIKMGLWDAGTWNAIGVGGSISLRDYNLLSRGRHLYLNRPGGYDMKFRCNNVEQMTLFSTGSLFIYNTTANPTTSPTLGGYLFVSGGALYWRSSSGVNRLIAAA